MQSLQANHGMGHTLFILLAEACMVLFNDCMRVFFLPGTPASNSCGWIFECMTSLIGSSCLVLSVILFISKECQSSLRVSSCSILTTSWSVSHTAWQLSPICLNWASNQSQPLVMLQEAQTFFWNFLCTELMAASYVSEHMRQSPVTDLGPESTALSNESLLESNSLPL